MLWCSELVKRAQGGGEMTLTSGQQKRLAEIRMHLEKFMALGVDTSDWEATFFFEILEQMRAELKQRI